MNINTLKNLIVPAEFTYKYSDGAEEKSEQIKIQIRRGKLNLEVVGKLEQVKENPQVLAPILFDLLDGWSLTEDDAGKMPYALNLENIIALPQDFLGELVSAVMEAVVGKQAKAAN